MNSGIMSPMSRPRAAWLTSLGLLGAGWVVAHVLSYVLLVPDPAERREMLMQTGHGYFDPAHLVVLSVTVTLAGLALWVTGAGRRGTPAPSPWLLALLPPVGFVVQEHLERIAVSGAFPAHLVAEPRFLVGLLLQLPFALAGLLCARALLLAARRLVEAGAPPLVDAPAAASLPANGLPFADFPRRRTLALGYSERGPPLSISV